MKIFKTLKRPLFNRLFPLFSLVWLTSLFVSVFASEPALQKPDAGNIDRLRLFSPQLNDTVTVDVWTPQDYARYAEPLPVIYMHDGQNLFDKNTTWNGQSWEMDIVTDSLINSGSIKAPVIVGVHSVAETRIGDLGPQKAIYLSRCPLDSLGRMTKTPLRGDAYAAFITETLRPVIEEKYNVSTAPEETFVMGSSMGGLMSWYMMCEYPEVYGGAGCLSTHWVGDANKGEYFPEAMLLYLSMNLPYDGDHKLYFDHGTGSYDAPYGPWQEIVDQMAEDRGYTRPDKLMSVIAEGAEHNEDAWRRRVHLPLLFLLKR